MQFRLQKEKQEADRKRIEAQGIKDFQTIVAQGITPGLLEWKGIEATEKLATSPNAKVVIVGNQKNGLPLVLDNVSREFASACGLGNGNFVETEWRDGSLRCVFWDGRAPA